MKKPIPVDGTVEVVSRFLWFPKTIGDTRRWFEIATWKREFLMREGIATWVDLEWINP